LFVDFNPGDMMYLNDFLYGKMEFPKIVAELLATDALKRLSGVHQSGAIFLVNPDLNHTRLEHAIGVMMLIKQLGGSELEQIAGLLHDVSHTAFSHVGDYVFGNLDENYHELIFEQMILKSTIPEVLQKYGYHIDEIFNGQFNILERALPNLCADRLDYTLRDGVYGGIISRQRARSFLNSVTLSDGKIEVAIKEEADWINAVYQQLNEEVFKLPVHVYANGKMAELIREFMHTGFITEADLFKTDTFLLNKIRSTLKGYDAIKSIKQLKGFAEYMRFGAVPKIKSRILQVG